MTRGLIYWVMILIWIVLVVMNISGAAGSYTHQVQIGGTIFELILFILIGWDLYGPMIRGGSPRA
jgi:hypothetical protein